MDVYLSDHFKLKEFQCKDGTPPPLSFATTIKDTIEFLESLRLYMNLELCRLSGKWREYGILVVSGYRTPEYNKHCGGSPGSRHMTGQAADVRPTRHYDDVFSYTDFKKLAEIVDASFPDRDYRLGFYSHKGSIAWIHVDCAYGYGGRRWGY